MSFEAYSVAVKLSLINNVSSGLLLISKNMKTVHDDAEKLNEKLKSIGKNMAIGGALFGGGFMIAGMFKGPLEEAQKFQTAMANFSLYGMSDKVNAEAKRFVTSMNSMGTSTVENMKIFTEAQGVFRESGRSDFSALEGAKIAAPVLAKIDYASQALSENSRAKLEHGKMAMLRYIEDSGGLKSAKRFNELADAGWKMVQTSGGSVDWEQLRQFKARAGVSAMNMTDDAVAQMEPLITMLKGQTAGFSLRTAYNRLNGIIKIPNQVAHNLVDNHIWDESKVVWNKQGGIKMFKGNPLINAEMFSQNPTEFYEKVIMPMYARSGIKTDASVAQMNAMIFGSTGGAMFTLMHKNMEKLHHSLEAQHKAKGIDASVDVANTTLAGQEVQLKAKWADLKLQIGQIVLPHAITFLSNLTSAIKDLTTWAKDNQGAVQLLTYTFMGLSTVLMGAGLILMIRGVAGAFGLLFTVLRAGGGISGAVLSGMAMIGKLIMFGLRAIPIVGWVLMAISIGIYLYRNWDTVKAKAKEIWGFISPYIIGTWQSVSNMASSLWDGIKSGMKSFVGFFLDQWQYLFNGLIGKLNAFLPKAAEITPLHFADDWNKDGKKPAAAPVPTKNQQPIHVHTTLTLDDKVFGHAVSKHFYNGVSKLPSSTGVNPNLGMPFPSSF